MNWVTITTSDLQDTKAAALVSAMQSAALGVGQSDPTANIIADVVARVRAEIKGWRANELDSDATKVPHDLKSLTCRMILRELQSRLQLPLNDDEREEQRNDLDYLKRIARGEVPVALPDETGSDEVQASAAVPTIKADDGVFNRALQEGL